MKKEKLSPGSISIKSFQTNFDTKNVRGVKGGLGTDCCTQQIANCQSAIGSGGCNESCGGTGGGGNQTLDCPYNTDEIISCLYQC
jgi:hypothetical protein